MLLHCSKPMEKFACGAHFAYAGIALVKGFISLGFAYLFFPMTDLSSYIGAFARLEFWCFIAGFIFGLGGCIFHIYGALDHRRNLGELRARRVRGKKSKA